MQKFRRTKYGLMVSSAALVALGLTTGMSSYKSVDVVVNGHASQEGTFAGETVAQFLAQQGVHVTGYDLVEPARATLLQNGMKIVVKKAKAITLRDGAKVPVEVHTLANTVGELLQSLRIRLVKGDRLNASASAPIRAGMHVVITKRKTVVGTESVALSYATERQASSAYTTGTDVVARSGQDGMARIVTRRFYVNGKLVMTRRQRRVIQQPVAEIIDVGTAQPPPQPQQQASAPVTARSSSSLVASEVLTVVATAYSNPGGFTATGAPAGFGDIAVDPSIIPLGTKLYIPGYGYGVANDTGGAIQGYRIDLCYNSVSQAIDFGRQVVKVYILKQ
ncbi:MAG: 3D domain-containing protein [Bacilli bacterium]